MPASADARILLDTYIAIWALLDDRRLRREAQDPIADVDNAVFVSAAGIWEIAIKRALGRSGIPFTANAARGYFADAGYRLLVVRPEHAAAIETLPNLHRDPFDRMLVAQAAIEPLHLITHDRIVARYSPMVRFV